MPPVGGLGRVAATEGCGVHDEVLDDARWWAGIPLAERRGTTLPSAGSRGAGELGVEEILRAEERLRRWHDVSVREGASLSLASWSTRLGIAQEALAILLGEAPESLRCRVPDPRLAARACRGRAAVPRRAFSR